MPASTGEAAGLTRVAHAQKQPALPVAAGAFMR
jgi:hypothetical protein